MLIVKIVIGLFLIFILWTLLEQRLLVNTHYKVKSDKLPRAFHNTHFVVLADLHNTVFGRDNERLLRKIQSCSPDFILVAGDMIEKGMACYPGDTYSLLASLAKTYKIYYAYGNHEQKLEKLLLEGCSEAMRHLCSTWIEYKEGLKSLGVTFLDNESTLIMKNGESLRLSGISIDARFFIHGKLYPMETGYITGLLGEKPQEVYQILIAHNPAYYKEYADWSPELIISGHLHGGLLRLPFIGGIISPQVRLFPKYSAGMHRRGNCQMIVSRGLGSHSLMPRVFNIPEIVEVTLQSEEFTDAARY